MNSIQYKNMIDRYKAAGINNGFKIKNIEDIKSIFGFDVTGINGYGSLGIAQGMFRKFIVNFYNAQGLEAREEIKPISVKIIKKSGSAYLKFLYSVGNHQEWLHVKNSNTYF